MDIRETIFQSISGRIYSAVIRCENGGVLSGTDGALDAAEKLGLDCIFCQKEGDEIHEGDILCSISGSPAQIVAGEDMLVGCLSKFSGIATAARRAVDLAAGRARIVSGSWKKMPPQIKSGVRAAILAGGASFRICDGGMVYLDKNYIRLLGSIETAMQAVEDIKDVTKVVQIKGFSASPAEEARKALLLGSRLLMIDTGDRSDIVPCLEMVTRMGLRDKVKIAFASGVRIPEIPALVELGVDIVCIGKDIVDAQLLDMRLDVEV